MDQRVIEPADGREDRYRLPAAPVTPPPGYVLDGKGHLVPEAQVRGTDQLEDQTVRAVMAFAVDLANQIDRFFHHSMADLEAFLQALADKYGTSKKGAEGRGNVTLRSYDGLLKLQFAAADRLTFGPGLQIARQLFDECVSEWAADARPELQALIADAFNTDKEGRVNREAVLRLLRLAIADARWAAAQEAIRDAIRVVGTKRYIRFYLRAGIDQPWQAIPIDISAASGGADDDP